MASYKQFEDLPVWNDALHLAAEIFELTSHPAFKFRGDLVNQIRRAALSVSNNIAEGFERGTTNDLIHFLFIARGSAGETRSMLRFSLLLDGMAPEKDGVESLSRKCEAVSRQLHGWIDALQHTEIKGDRAFTDSERQRYESERRSDEFWEALKEGRLQELVAARKAEEEATAANPVTPPCPQCGRQMRKCHDRNGSPFWGCIDYPRCRGSRPWR